MILSKADFDNLINQDKPTYLIALNKLTQIEVDDRINDYLNKGLALDIHNRYKTSIRDKWYEVPNVGIPAEAFFFKRCNEYPKLIKNDAEVLATDSAYTISKNKDYEIESLIYSFYNSLTLSFAELNGRYYGGGVLELTPNEFKGLPIPYNKITSADFKTFAKDFKAKKSIKEIALKNDTSILKSIDNNISLDEIDKIFRIREKLYSRRIKTN